MANGSKSVCARLKKPLHFNGERGIFFFGFKSTESACHKILNRRIGKGLSNVIKLAWKKGKSSTLPVFTLCTNSSHEKNNHKAFTSEDVSMHCVTRWAHFCYIVRRQNICGKKVAIWSLRMRKSSRQNALKPNESQKSRANP